MFRALALGAALAGSFLTAGAARAQPVLTDVTATAGLAGFEWTRAVETGGVAFLDYDGDGRPDLFTTNGANRPKGLFHNNGDGTFTDVTATAGLGAALGHAGAGVCWGDFDNDGDPDLVLAGRDTELYRNNG